jgi:hypothetical protein
MLNSQTEPQSAGFWQTVASVLAALARKGGGSLTENPLPELRYAAREWNRAADTKNSGFSLAGKTGSTEEHRS